MHAPNSTPYPVGVSCAVRGPPQAGVAQAPGVRRRAEVAEGAHISGRARSNPGPTPATVAPAAAAPAASERLRDVGEQALVVRAGARRIAAEHPAVAADQELLEVPLDV